MQGWYLTLVVISLASPGATETRLVVCDDVTDPLTLDPHKQFAEKNHTLLQQIYEGLVRFDSEGRIVPALAVSWERIDPLRMRFHLREGVRFHNGDLFDAEAVRFTLERYQDPRTGFPALGFINSIKKAEVKDPLTVDIVTHFPDGLLLNRLAGFILVVPPRHVRDSGPDALEKLPVGTGPFRFAQWHKRNHILLEANREYWMKGYPKVDAIVFRFIPWELQVRELLAGRVHILTELPGTSTAEVMRSTVAAVVKRQTFYAMVGPMNVTQGPLQDKRVRQALNFAVNREDLLRYDVLGNGRTIATLSLPGEEGHNPQLRPYPFDPKRARALLREAGYRDRMELKVLVKEQGIRTARILMKQMERVGVRLKVQVTDDSKIIKDIGSDTWDMLFGGCPDPMNHMFFIASLVFYSKSPYSIVKDLTLDRLIEEMSETLDPTERERKARELDRYIYEESLSLFTYQRVKTYGVDRHVRFKPYVTGMPYFFDVEVQHEEAKVLGQVPR